MSRRAANTQKLMGDLLLSGLNGQLRPGDTIGIWTFNEKLYAGTFPLQLWMPQARQRIATSVLEFLRLQRYEKKAQVEKALGPMMQVVKNSDKITVVLVSDGNTKISGTPFDNEIDEASKLNYAPQRKLRMPSVTVLRARKGEFIGWKVCAPPWPLEFPEFPVEPQVSKAHVSKEEPKPLPKPPAVPSLVVVGQKPEPVSTNSGVAGPAKLEPTPAPPTAPKPASGPAATPAPDTTPIVKRPEAATQTTQAAGSSLTTIPTTQQQATVVPNEPASTPKTGTTPSSPLVTGTVADPGKVQTAPDSQPRPAESAPAKSSTETSVIPGMATPAPTQSAVQIAVASPSETVFSRTRILIVAMALLLVALGLVYALMRRSRTTEKVSLITRSMDRDNK